MFYENFGQVPDWRKKVIKETMFTDSYTDFNNDPDRGGPDNHCDPLNLKNCMRFYPHDDNQGGFFVCVMEKIWDEDDGIVQDTDYSMDAWSNQNVRQKDIIDDLDDFVKDFEASIREQEALTGEKDDGEALAQMKAMIADEITEKEKQKSETKGSLENQIDSKKREEEDSAFPFVKLIDTKVKLWHEIADFYGIDTDKFPSDQLAFQQGTGRNIVLMGSGLNELMTYRRKNKLNVINMGLKLFARNKGNQPSLSSFRIRSEGLDILLPFMSSKRIVAITKEIFVEFTKSDDNQITFEDMKEKWKINDFESKPLGSAVVTFDSFAVTVWLGKNNVSLMVSKEEI